MTDAANSVGAKIQHPKLLWKLWLVFTVIFFLLGSCHIIASKKFIEPFEASELELRSSDEYGAETVGPLTDVDITAPLKDFVKDFNEYLEEYNCQSRQQNIFAAIGYFICFSNRTNINDFGVQKFLDNFIQAQTPSVHGHSFHFRYKMTSFLAGKTTKPARPPGKILRSAKAGN